MATTVPDVITKQPRFGQIPSPSWILLLASVWLIGYFTWLGSRSLGDVLLASNAVSQISTGVFPAWFFTVAIAQYFGVFRRFQVALALAIIQLSLMVMGLLIEYGGSLYQEHSPSPGDLAYILMGLGFCLCIGLDIRWLIKQRQYLRTGKVNPAPLRFTMWHLLGCLILLGCIFGVARARYVDGYSAWVHGIARSEAPIVLPSDASDITYTMRSTDYLDCEFATSEEAFQSWFENELPNEVPFLSDTKLQPITQSEVRRFSYSGPGQSNQRVKVNDGLSASWQNDGIVYQATFDRETQRGYFRRQTLRY